MPRTNALVRPTYYNNDADKVTKQTIEDDFAGHQRREGDERMFFDDFPASDAGDPQPDRPTAPSRVRRMAA